MMESSKDMKLNNMKENKMKITLLFMLIYSQLFAEDLVTDKGIMDKNSSKTFQKNPLLPESTVAVVNGIAISEHELEREVAVEMPNTYFHSTVDGEKLEDLKKKALEKLVKKNLLYSYGLSKVSVTKDEIEDIMEAIIEQNESEEYVVKGLKQLGYTVKTFKKAVKKEELLRKLRIKELKVSISDDELREYYDKNMYKFKEPEKIRVRMIYIRNDPKDPEGHVKAKSKVEEAMEKIKAGEDFADIAAEYSNAMSRIKGGDMGFLHRGRLDKEVEEEAFALKKGDMSEIIEKNIGFYIVKVEDKITPPQKTFEEIKAGLKKELEAKEEKIKREKLLEKLMATAVIIK